MEWQRGRIVGNPLTLKPITVTVNFTVRLECCIEWQRGIIVGGGGGGGGGVNSLSLCDVIGTNYCNFLYFFFLVCPSCHYLQLLYLFQG